MNVNSFGFLLAVPAVFLTAPPPAPGPSKGKQQDFSPKALRAGSAGIGRGGLISGVTGWVRCARN
jgi:hypothetical protein